MGNDFSKIKAITLDCYGTLIDWENGIWDALQPILSKSSRISLSKGEALQQFAVLESQEQCQSPTMQYPEILKSVHHRFAEQYRLETNMTLDQKFGESISKWRPFADSSRALQMLQSRYKLIILSNVHRKGFEESQQKLNIQFDAVYTAEEIGSYKPNLRNFEYMLHRIKISFGVELSDVLHVAQSLYHDHEPARRLGLANVWIDRNNHFSKISKAENSNWGATSPVSKVPKLDFVFKSMEEFARAAVE